MYRLAAWLKGGNHSLCMIYYSGPRHAFRWFNYLIQHPQASRSLRHASQLQSVTLLNTTCNYFTLNSTFVLQNKRAHTSISVILHLSWTHFLSLALSVLFRTHFVRLYFSFLPCPYYFMLLVGIWGIASLDTLQKIENTKCGVFVKPVGCGCGESLLSVEYRAGGGWRLFLSSRSAGPQKTAMQHMFWEDEQCVCVVCMCVGGWRETREGGKDAVGLKV